MLNKLAKSVGVLALSGVITMSVLTAAVHAQASGFSGPQVVDRKGKVIGTLIATNTVLVTVGKKQFAVKFKAPGFDVFTEIDQAIMPTVYYESNDCSGPMYYSDQADGMWKRNLTPSVYDVPSTGMLIGVTASDVDREFYAKADLYYPDGSPTKVTVKSKRVVGEHQKVSDCFQMTPDSAQLWQVRKVTLSSQPPLRLK
jgi:hypothetical protein